MTSKVVIQTDSRTLEYYQSIYTHCKQRFNIPDRIETFKKTLYQYIENCINNYLLGDYNISEYCKENYPVEQKFSLNFESETEKGKEKKKQKLKTTPNTLKTTVKHLQTPEPGTSFKLPLLITLFPALPAQLQTSKDFQSPKSLIQQEEPILTSTNLIDYLAKNQSEETKSEQETENSENEEEMVFTYITKIPEFTGENNKTSSQEWLDKVSKAEDANETFKTAFLEHESVMTYLRKFNKLLRRICQLETNEYYSNAQILNQFIAGLKDKLIKKVHPHVPEDLATAIQQAKNYKMVMKEANCTKLLKTTLPTNSNNSSCSNHNNHKDTNPHNDTIKTTLDHHPTTKSKIAITVESLATGKKIAESYNETNKIGVINVIFHYSNLIINYHHQFTIHQDLNTKITIISSLHSQSNSNTNNYPHNIIKPNHYYTQLNYLTIPEEQDFYHTALSEGRAAAQQQNSSHNHTTIPSARIAENANLSDIFLFEFEIIIPVKVLVIDASQLGNPRTTNLLPKTTCLTPAFEFESEEEKPIIKTFMALGSTSNWANETEQKHFTPHSKPETSGWNTPYSKTEPRKQCPYILLKCKNCHKKLLSMGACISPEEEYENGTLCLTCGKQLPDECDWIDIAFRGGVCDQTCQYALSIVEKVKHGIPFNATYNSTLSKLYHYPHNTKMIYKLAMVLINRGTKEDVFQIKEAKYIEYTLKLAGFDYEDEVKCSECYALSIPLPNKSNEYEIEFGEPEATEKIETTSIYLIKNQPASQLKYFNNNRQGIKLEKAHEIDTGYDLQYLGKDTLVLQPNFFTKINLKIVLKILPGAMV
ncbi:hypothetical protein G9A89_003041 [Geosiphon pyriformis]|nr:hypothetical protein G9A89_003041 [Geosiphon pyriformis]